MNRAELVQKLSRVSAALAATDLIPILTHFWFTGERVLAHNDQIAISVVCKTPFAGAVPRTLLDLLNRSRAKDVDFEVKDSTLIVKAASARFSLGLLPKEDFLFTMPTDTGNQTLDAPAARLMSALELCLNTLGRDSSVPDQLGVTLIPSKNRKGMFLYSLNGPTLTRTSVECVNPPDRVILHGMFCEQLLKLMKQDEKVKIEIGPDYSLATSSRGDVLFGRLLDVEDPVNFAEIVANRVPKDFNDVVVPIPTKLQLILERALVITDSATDPGHTAVIVRNGRMKFESKSPRGVVDDSMQVGEQHPDVTASFTPKHLKIGYGNYDKMLITDSCAIMSGPSALFFVAAVGQ